MHQNPLKILCAYHDTEPDWLGVAPEDALLGHHLTIVHSYREAKEAILDSSNGTPSFDVVLADVGLPGGFKGEESFPLPFCPIMLQPYMDQMLVRGFGIFVPRKFESIFELSDGYSVVVARQDCWTPLDRRDWHKMLEFVIKAWKEVDQFHMREPREGID